VANGSQTTGNGFVTGTFGATNLVGNTIGGGWVGVSANLNLQSNLISGNVTVNATTLGVGTSLIAQINVQTSGNTAQIVDSFVGSLFGTGEYTLTVTNNPSNGYATSKLLVLSDTSTHAYITEWAQMNSNGSLGTFSANISGGNVNLIFTPSVANAQIKGYRTWITL
jgi:hypothetical protein